MARELEQLIAPAPEQWHLLQPNWPSDFAALGRAMPEWFETNGGVGPPAHSDGAR